MKLKRSYERAEIEAVELNEKDVILTSAPLDKNGNIMDDTWS